MFAHLLAAWTTTSFSSFSFFFKVEKVLQCLPQRFLKLRVESIKTLPFHFVSTVVLHCIISTWIFFYLKWIKGCLLSRRLHLGPINNKSSVTLLKIWQAQASLHPAASEVEAARRSGRGFSDSGSSSYRFKTSSIGSLTPKALPLIYLMNSLLFLYTLRLFSLFYPFHFLPPLFLFHTHLLPSLLPNLSF